MPDWSSLGDYLIRGFVVVGAFIAYYIPILIVRFCFQITIALLVGSAGESGLGGLGAVAALCLTIPFFAFTIIALFILWVGMIRYAASEDISAFIQIGRNFTLLRANFGAMIGTYLLLLAVIFAGLIASMLFFWTICGPIILFTYISAVMGHILGQLARRLDIVYQPTANDFWA